MWPRVVEIMLGLWLAASPFIFRHDPGAARYWYNDLICASLVLLLGFFSFSERFRLAHLATLAVGLWLLGFGRFSSATPSAALQNNITIGLLLIMFAIIPNEASRPPRSWRNLSG